MQSLKKGCQDDDELIKEFCNRQKCNACNGIDENGELNGYGCIPLEDFIRENESKIIDIEMSEIPDCGGHITMFQFIECVTRGYFTDYDGHGYYANYKEMSNKIVYPSDVHLRKLDYRFSHVVWFNNNGGLI